MSYRTIVISSGHGLYVRGASGILDEVDEARQLVDYLAVQLAALGVEVITFHDDVSTTQNENLNTIVDFHNTWTRDLDISVHFNAYEQVSEPMGVEVLHISQGPLAGEVSAAIARAGRLINRGAKYRDDLFFLNSTTAPSIMLEVCFVDSEADCKCYQERFEEIAKAIADLLTVDGYIEEFPVAGADSVVGKVSWFGGPEDTGVSADEGLAFIYDIQDAPYLFLPYQPEGTSGLARRLNPFVHYIAMRWDYEKHPKETMLEKIALVRSLKTGFALQAVPADWGPNEATGRVADLSLSLMEDLGLSTDDEVEVIFPYSGV